MERVYVQHLEYAQIDNYRHSYQWICTFEDKILQKEVLIPICSRNFSENQIPMFEA